MNQQEILKKYDDFSAAARGNDLFDSGTTVLISLAASLAIGCYP